MESRVKLLGHPIHPMIIVFPLGLLATAVIFDILYLVLGTLAFETAAFYMIAAGVVGGLTAAIFGFLDWLNLPSNTRAKSIGGMHGLGNLIIVILFAGSWLLRLPAANHIASTFALLLSFVGAGLSLITAWLGGEMVYRMRVGVDQGAQLNAPSSLSDQPASANVQDIHR